MPYERLINALTREQSAAVRINGSDAASGIWNMVKMALCWMSVGSCQSMKIDAARKQQG
jgi:hypothetical protein